MSKWEMVRLNEVCDFQGGSQPPKEEWISEHQDGYIRMLQIRDFTQERDGKEEYVKLSIKTKTCEAADILIARYGASVGKILTGLAGAYNVAIIKTIPDTNRLTKPYLRYYLLSSKFQNFIQNVGSRAAQAGFNKNDLDNLTIYLPPIEVQKKIAQTLDAASELIALRKKQLVELDNLIKATFYDMFGDPVVNEKGWEIVCIKDLAKKIQYGTSAKANETSGEYPILRMNNITYNGSMDLSNLKYINLEEKDKEKFLVYKGELLFNRTNSKELVGKTAVFKEERPMAFAGYLVKLVPNEKANSEFISRYLNSSYGKSLLMSMAKSIIGMANINAKELGNISIYLPPIIIQNQFAQIITKIEEQKALVQKALNESQHLFDSLMSQYF